MLHSIAVAQSSQGVTSETDPLNFVTTHGWDPLNRLISTVDRGSFTTGMTYDTHDPQVRQLMGDFL